MSNIEYTYLSRFFQDSASLPNQREESGYFFLLERDDPSPEDKLVRKSTSSSFSEGAFQKASAELDQREGLRGRGQKDWDSNPELIFLLKGVLDQIEMNNPEKAEISFPKKGIRKHDLLPQRKTDRNPKKLKGIVLFQEKKETMSDAVKHCFSRSKEETQKSPERLQATQMCRQESVIPNRKKEEGEEEVFFYYV